MQRLRPDTSSGTSPQPTLAVANSESGWVQVLMKGEATQASGPQGLTGFS